MRTPLVLILLRQQKSEGQPKFGPNRVALVKSDTTHSEDHSKVLRADRSRERINFEDYL